MLLPNTQASDILDLVNGMTVFSLSLSMRAISYQPTFAFVRILDLESSSTIPICTGLEITDKTVDRNEKAVSTT